MENNEEKKQVLIQKTKLEWDKYFGDRYTDAFNYRFDKAWKDYVVTGNFEFEFTMNDRFYGLRELEQRFNLVYNELSEEEKLIYNQNKTTLKDFII